MRIPRTILAVAVGLGALLPALAAGTPAAAADPINCCQVGINGLPDKIQAGAPPRFFTVRFQNNAQRPVTRLSITFTAQAPAIRSGQLHLQRQNGNNWHGVNLSRRGDGLYRGTDTFGLDNGGIQPGETRSWTYQVSASKATAAGPISVALVATGRIGDGHDTQQGELASSPTYTTSIVAVAAAPTPTPTPTPSASDTPTPADSAEVTAPASTDAPVGTGVAPASGSGGGMAWLAYTVGALLLLGGIATIGTILWRRGPQEVETEWEQPPPPPAAPPAWAPPPVDPYDTNIGMPPYPAPAPTATYPTTTATRPVYGNPTTYGAPHSRDPR